jgi:hypothetical protein
LRKVRVNWRTLIEAKTLFHRDGRHFDVAS